MKVINVATLILLGMIRTLLIRFPILYFLKVIYFIWLFLKFVISVL